MLQKCTPWPCLFLDLFVEDLHYKTLFFVDNFYKVYIFKLKICVAVNL